MSEVDLILRDCESNEIPIDYTILNTKFLNLGIWESVHDSMKYLLMDVVGIKELLGDWLGNDLKSGTTGSFNGKGGTWYTGSETSQSFSYETKKKI